MIITIQGQDYTSMLDAVQPLAIERKLNQPSLCEFWISIPPSSSLPTPSRFQTVSLLADNGFLLFTGFIGMTPMPVYAGLASSGATYRYLIKAYSDEYLLDQALMSTSTGSTGQTVSTVLQTLVQRSGVNTIQDSALSVSTTLGRFVPHIGANWSTAAGLAASEARTAYRALSSTLTVQPVGSTVHTLTEGQGSFSFANLTFAAADERALANDITVCGEHEPAAYITEYFQGDGTTVDFYLSQRPYLTTASHRTLVDDLFNQGAINTADWSVEGSSYLTTGSGGLAMNGGTGIDGQAMLSWLDPIEMGGTLLLEADGISLSPGSTGVVAAFYNGASTQSGCTAGFAVTSQQGTGTVSVQPLLDGSAAGVSYALNATDLYTLRLRIHAGEMYRAQQYYRSFGDSGQIVTGGEWVLAGARVHMEVQQIVNGVSAMPVTLYDGTLASLPVTCTLVPASSTNLIGSMRSLTLENLGSIWVVSTPPSGSAYTRTLGTSVNSAECNITAAGKLLFYTGFTPVAGEQIAVSYRAVERAVGRAVNAASQAAFVAAGSPATAVWIGSVTRPAARTSADCRNAAAAMVQASASQSALWVGTYKATADNFTADVWPGDALQLAIPSASINGQVVVRAIKITYTSTTPDVLNYAVAFANEWADDLAIHTSITVPTDAWLPALVSPAYLANLSALVATSITTSAITVAAGVTPPTGGGFEVRTADNVFMAGQDSTLVLRSPVPNFTFARASANDKFFIRMYDGSTPPNYSEFSTAFFINLPFA